MDVNESLKKMINEDIKNIDRVLQNPGKTALEAVYNDVIGKYTNLIINFKEALESHFYNMSGAGLGISPNILARDLQKMKSKLESCKNSGYQNLIMNDSYPFYVTNESVYDADVKFIADSIRNNSYLVEEEIDEILKKLEEIETIIKTTDTKSKKWQQLKPYLNWLSTKSADIALLIMPVFLKLK